ncbi:MAG: hypothetical protein U1G07_14125 [Verrucomicrobiota bacterium]
MLGRCLNGPTHLPIVNQSTLPAGPNSSGETRAAGAIAVQLPPDEEVAGTRIGRYKRLQKLGEGGCGIGGWATAAD